MGDLTNNWQWKNLQKYKESTDWFYKRLDKKDDKGDSDNVWR